MSKSPPRARLSIARRRRRYTLRRSVWWAAAVLVVGLLVLADRAGIFGHAPQPDAETYHGGTFRVTRVVDGDTLDVDLADTVTGRPATRVRLWGVDTPETARGNTAAQHFGPEAGRFTRLSCADKTVRLELVKGKTRGKYKRLLAYVYLPDGPMLNAELIARGFGYADPRFAHPRSAEFARLQSKARRGRLGLWKDLRPEGLPYYFRQGRYKLDLP